MLQLLDLARENAELKCQLARILREAEALRRLLSIVGQTSAAERFGLSISQRESEPPWRRGRF
jgi:hypothetical protein